MLRSLRVHFRRWQQRPKVRPWAVAGPVLILLITLPLLRPLRHPAEIADDEWLRLRTVQSLVERRTLAIARVRTDATPSSPAGTSTSTLPVHGDEPLMEPSDPSLRRRLLRSGDRVYSGQPPVFAILLAGPYWVMARWGYTFERYTILAPYLLTVIGTTLPVAIAAGLIYRMARMFELKRPWRAALGVACVTGTGLLSYATVLNAHAPAAVLVLGAAGSVIQLARSPRPNRAGGWLVLAGLCAALATTLDPAAAVVGVLLVFVILAIRLSPGLRVGGALLYAIGALPPIALHCAALVPITGDVLPGRFHRELAMRSTAAAAVPMTPRHDRAAGSVSAPGADEAPTVIASKPSEPIAPADTDDEGFASDSSWLMIGRTINRFFIALLGSHGIFSHFPVIVLGIAGVFAVMHRHWLPWTKTLAAASLIGGATIVTVYCLLPMDWRQAMFATRWFVVFLPLLLFWSGAWSRRPHGTGTWSVAIALLAFSTFISIVGATDPYPRRGFDRYTAVAALMQLIRGQEAPTTPTLKDAAVNADGY